jgi:hypothetical protein
VQHLIEERGRNAKLIDWLDEITADCPKKQAHNMNDPCGARCPDLPRVFQTAKLSLVSRAHSLGYIPSPGIGRKKRDTPFSLLTWQESTFWRS